SIIPTSVRSSCPAEVEEVQGEVMQRDVLKRVGGALGLALVLVAAGEGAAPPPRADQLPPGLAKEVKAREMARPRAVLAGKFDEALRLATQIVVVRQRWQGPRHRETIAARLDVERWRRLADLTEARQKQMARAVERSAEGTRLRGQGRAVAAEA